MSLDTWHDEDKRGQVENKSFKFEYKGFTHKYNTSNLCYIFLLKMYFEIKIY